MKGIYLLCAVVCLSVACSDDAEPEVLVSDGASTDFGPGGFVADGGVATGNSSGTDQDTGEPVEDGAAEDGAGVDKPDSSSPTNPRVLSLSVTAGPGEGGTATVVVTAGFATDFRDTLPEIRFGGELATNLTALSRGVVSVLTPKGPVGKTVDVKVKGEKNNGTLEDAYTYLDNYPANYVLIKIAGHMGPSGSPALLPVTLEVVGNVQPAAVLVNVKVDLLELPVAAPNPIPGDVHTQSDKEIVINPDKFDTVRMIVLGKNRNLLKSGTIAKLAYSVPPTDPWLVTPLAVTAEAVDPLGIPIKVITHSGWVGVAPKNEATP